MSKKIASGADKIVLDVKVGSGAFMKDVNSARKLAKTMVEIGKNVGKETVALLTNMDEPLGFAIGNALEVKEAILALKGEGPKDLTELMLELGAHMVVLGEKADSLEEAKAMLKTNIENGKALQYFKRLVEAQGGNAEVIDTLSFKEATYQIDVFAKEAGYVAEIAADELGRASMLLGAGRRTKDDVIDLSVGLYLHKKVGDRVTKGEVLCTIHANDENIRHIKKIIENSIQISVEKKGKPLIIDVIK